MNAEAVVREIARDRRRGSTALAERALDALEFSRAVAPDLLGLRAMPVIDAVVRLAMRRGVAFARRRLRKALGGLVRQARRILPDRGTFATFGSSGTIDAVVEALGVRVRPLPADVALVGADALLPDGAFVNQRGTAAFVAKARRAGAAVFVVATTLKRTKGARIERGFELVPGHLVHGTITERGLSTPDHIAPPGPEPMWMSRGPVGLVQRGGCHPHH